MEHHLRERGPRASEIDRRLALRTAFSTEALGWLGAVALLLSFALGAASLVKPTSAAYLGLNLFGAMGLAHASLSRRAYSPALLNIIWAVIAAVSLLFVFVKA